MTTHDRLMAYADVLLEQLLMHPWHVNADAMSYTLDCRCTTCVGLASLRNAILDEAEAHIWRKGAPDA